MADRTATINGVVPSWADMSFEFSLYEGRTVEIVDISALNFAENIEVGEKRGAGGRLRGTTRGQGTPEASATMYQEGWNVLEEALAEVNADNMSLVMLTVRALWTPPGSSRIDKVEIVGSRVVGLSSSNAEGVDPSAREITFKPIKLKLNGRQLLGG